MERVTFNNIRGKVRGQNAAFDLALPLGFRELAAESGGDGRKVVCVDWWFPEEVRQEAKPDACTITFLACLLLTCILWPSGMCASLLFPDGASMSRTDKALLVSSLYRVASMLIRVFLEV